MLRITGGVIRGLKLAVPRRTGTRPTMDRVREAIFDMLGSVESARVADLYAGTGALGLEALSRGAEYALFVENAPGALAVLRRNCQSVCAAIERSLGRSPEMRIIPCAVERLPVTAHSLAGTFDIVFADPPYHRARNRPGSMDMLKIPGLLEWIGSALLVVEHGADARLAPLLPPGWRILRERKYGATAVTIMGARPPAGSP